MWSHIAISDPIEAVIKSREYATAVAAFALGRRDRMDAALFSNLDHSGEMHYYFSPQAEAVAAAFGVPTCNKPLRIEIGKLLFCNDSAVADRLYK